MDCTIATSESPPEWALGSSRNVWVAYPTCVFKRGQRTDSCQSQSSLAIEEASATVRPARMESLVGTSSSLDLIAIDMPAVPAPRKPDDRQFKVGDKIRVNLHHGKIEDAVVRAVIEHTDGTKLQVDVVGLDLTALIDTWQVVG